GISAIFASTAFSPASLSLLAFSSLARSLMAAFSSAVNPCFFAVIASSDNGTLPSLYTSTEITEFAGQLFFRLWRASHTRTSAALDSIGLTPATFALLNVLGARDGAIQSQLSSDMGIDPSAMVKLIDELETAGLAERRPRPGDRRAWEVSITAK